MSTAIGVATVSFVPRAMPAATAATPVGSRCREPLEQQRDRGEEERGGRQIVGRLARLRTDQRRETEHDDRPQHAQRADTAPAPDAPGREQRPAPPTRG